jgi:hypothetical protein
MYHVLPSPSSSSSLTTILVRLDPPDAPVSPSVVRVVRDNPPKDAQDGGRLAGPTSSRVGEFGPDGRGECDGDEGMGGDREAKSWLRLLERNEPTDVANDDARAPASPTPANTVTQLVR